MELLPHLTFLESFKRSAGVDKLPRGGSPLSIPTASAQFSRFKAHVNKMQEQFSEHITLCDSVNGMSPEKILVLEVAGSVDNFAKSLQKVEGFEYLSHWLTDDVVEEGNVYHVENNKRKPVKREIYLTMSNQDGLSRLFTEWKKISATGFVGYGFTPLKNALCQLHDIRFWDTEDRLKKTGLIEDWEHRLKDASQHGAESVSFEIELWFRQSLAARSFAERELKTLIAAHGGSITGSFVHTGIAYHALRGELPIDQVQAVIERGAQHLEFMRSDDVMFFRPLGQCGFTLSEESFEASSEEIKTADNNTDISNAVVALFDGLPLENHEAIKNHIVVDDPDNYSENYLSPSEQLHGTAMASLIIHGDKNAEERSLTSPLYVRPILAPGRPNFNGQRQECIPEGTLPLDLIHRAVKRLFEGDRLEPPVAPNIKVINLSVCDPHQLFDRNMSPWARMLDWLSHHYKVLFVVSAGNHSDDLDLDVSQANFMEMNSDEKQETILKSLNNSRWSRRMMSPAEAVNAITVKASHYDHSDVQTMPGIIDPFFTNGMFSPINPVTLGKAGGIKPEIMVPGGRVTYQNTTYLDADLVRLRVQNTPKPFGPGHKVAVPGSALGNISNYAFSFGTSNAAALTTRRIAMLQETVESMKEFQKDNALECAPASLILKALIVHGAELPVEATTACANVVRTKENSRTYKNDQGQYFGYGQIHEQRIHACKSNQATLIRTGELLLDESEIYSFPLPPCLASSEEPRRMIITLAWFSPVNSTHNEYRQAQMWVSDAKKSSALDFSEGDYYHHHQKKGTVYHDVVHGSKASPYLSGDEIQLKVNCKARAGGRNIKIPYAFVVTLDAPNTKLRIYDEVKNALEEKIRQNANSKIEVSSN